MDFRRQSIFLSILGLLVTTTLVTSTTTSSTSLGPITDLPIVNAVVSPDGYPRSAVLAGGLLPGPVITGNKGDHFKINVIDGLSDDTMARATSVHWHGLFQKGTPWADGPSFVTQCPITPDNSFLYEFDVPDQAGTFWYHSHFSTQYCDGLRGAFIVYDPDNDPYKDMYDVDDESTIITLADWYHLPASVLASLPPPPQWNSTLINGIGRVKGGPAVPLAVVNVEYGKKYRLRVIEMACQPAYNFSIDSHELTVIEVDGEYTQPHTVSSVPIFVGQRYSLILDASQPVGNYPIRADPSTGTGGFEGGINMAILRYLGAPIEEPDWHVQEDNDPSPLHEEDLHALIDPAAPGEPRIDGADVNINMVFSIDFTTGKFAINNATWIPPTVPILLQILSGAQSATDLLPSGSLYPLPLNQTIQITLTPDATATRAGAPHPFHLHGHSFSVVRSAGSSVYNWDNPVRRDVVSTGVTGDNVTIRFRTDNGGPWFLHCHIDWHLDEGLAVVLAEDMPEIKSESVPTDWKNLCPTYDNFDS